MGFAADPKVIAEVVRLPAALSIPGDTLAGAAASRRDRGLFRDAVMTLSSTAIYLAGMALNDYADRDIDAGERPDRPIPSGRIDAEEVKKLAAGLTAAGVGLSVVADGPRALTISVPLAATVAAYDLKLKDSLEGTVAMAACRVLDVLAGAGPGARLKALPVAATIGLHTAALTHVSRGEVEGGDESRPIAALAGTAVVLAAAGHLICRGERPAGIAGVGIGLGLLGLYARDVASAYLDAVDDPSPSRMKRAVGTAVLGLIPLQAALTAGKGRPAAALATAALYPLARKLSRRRSVT